MAPPGYADPNSYEGIDTHTNGYPDSYPDSYRVSYQDFYGYEDTPGYSHSIAPTNGIKIASSCQPQVRAL